MRRRLAKGTGLDLPRPSFDYRRLLLENHIEKVVSRLRDRPDDIPAVARLIRDSNSVVMLRASEAIKSAVK